MLFTEITNEFLVFQTNFICFFSPLFLIFLLKYLRAFLHLTILLFLKMGGFSTKFIELYVGIFSLSHSLSIIFLITYLSLSFSYEESWFLTFPLISDKKINSHAQILFSFWEWRFFMFNFSSPYVSYFYQTFIDCYQIMTILKYLLKVWELNHLTLGYQSFSQLIQCCLQCNIMTQREEKKIYQV